MIPDPEIILRSSDGRGAPLAFLEEDEDTQEGGDENGSESKIV